MTKEERYVQWLTNKMKGRYYDSLLSTLYDIQWPNSYFDEPVDDLRNEYKDTQSESMPNTKRIPATALEVLIIESINLSKKPIDARNPAYIDIFWKRIDDFGFSKITNQNFKIGTSATICNRIMRYIVEKNTKGE